MEAKVNLTSFYAPSDDVVAREIEGELVIVPLAAGVGNMEDELFTLNETGRAIWDILDGKRSLKDIVAKLSTQFDAPAPEIERDTMGLVEELVKRRIVIEVTRD